MPHGRGQTLRHLAGRTSTRSRRGLFTMASRSCWNRRNPGRWSRGSRGVPGVLQDVQTCSAHSGLLARAAACGLDSPALVRVLMQALRRDAVLKLVRSIRSPWTNEIQTHGHQGALTVGVAGGSSGILADDFAWPYSFGRGVNATQYLMQVSCDSSVWPPTAALSLLG